MFPQQVIAFSEAFIVIRGRLRKEVAFAREGQRFVQDLGRTQEFLGMLKLKSKERVLDVGCGIGGGDFLMAGNYDVFVHGVDLSVNMVLIALERASQAKKSTVSYQNGFLAFLSEACK